MKQIDPKLIDIGQPSLWRHTSSRPESNDATDGKCRFSVSVDRQMTRKGRIDGARAQRVTPFSLLLIASVGPMLHVL